MRILCAFDKFKGTATSLELGRAFAEGCAALEATAAVDDPLECRYVAFSDGGDGFLSAIPGMRFLCAEGLLSQTLALHEVRGPLGTSVASPIGVLDGVVYLECSLVCGLRLLAQADRNPGKTSSFGLGQLMMVAYRLGYRRFVVGLGGSSTNDAGLGALQACGLQLFLSSEDGESVLLQRPVTGNDLQQMVRFDYSGLPQDLSIILACDVTNPFLGPAGAVYTFSAQKGASPHLQAVLESGMENVARLFPHDVVSVPGSGAAGGIAGGFLAFFPEVQMVRGVEVVAAAVNLCSSVQEADVVVTGEGSYDEQTGHGKVVSYLDDLCQSLRKPLYVICGQKRVDPPAQTSIRRVWALAAIFGFERSQSAPDQCMSQIVRHVVEVALRDGETPGCALGPDRP